MHTSVFVSHCHVSGPLQVTASGHRLLSERGLPGMCVQTFRTVACLGWNDFRALTKHI